MDDIITFNFKRIFIIVYPLADRVYLIPYGGESVELSIDQMLDIMKKIAKKRKLAV